MIRFNRNITFVTDMKLILQFILLSLSIVVLSGGCKKGTTPKPRGYFRIDFPEKLYRSSNPDYPYIFDYPVYANIVVDKDKLAEPYWINIVFQKNKAKLHLSYKPVQNNLQALTEDSRELAYKHSIKASAINEKLFINNEKKVYGTIYEIKGNAASPLQFHLTDSTSHFLRGSFYISEIPNYDSLRPVIQFIDDDIYHLIETLSWK